MPLSIFNFERAIPARPWRRLAVLVGLLTLGAAVAWEIRCRAWGYAPMVNDTPDLWAQRREAVQPGSPVIIGDSRPWFDLDLDELEQGLGRRPVQLAMPGGGAYPVLADLAADERFHGTVICSVLPRIFFAPSGPALETPIRALQRFKTWTLAQRASHQLGMLAEEQVAFLKEDELTLSAWLQRLPIPNRADAIVRRPRPPYFRTLDRERRARMIEQCAQPGALQTRVRQGWLRGFTPPPLPSYLSKEAFLDGVAKAVETRFHDTTAAVEKIRARGGKVVFVRFPFSGELKILEDRATPRAGPWTRLLKDTAAPGIYFEDYPELAAFDCPEWSHLTAADSVEFTKRLVPHLKKALGQ